MRIGIGIGLGFSQPSFGAGVVGVDFAQRLQVDSSPGALGVVGFSQAVTVTGDPSPAALTSLLDRADLTGWLDLAEPSSYTVSGGTTVPSLANRKNGALYTEATNPPLYDATGSPLGGPCIVNDGVRQLLSTVDADVLALMQDRVPFTLYMVCKIDTLSVQAAFFGAARTDHSSNSSKYFGARAATNSYLMSAVNSAATVAFINATTPNNTSWHRVCWRFNGTHATIRVDNGADDPALTALDPGPTCAPTRLGLFCRPGTSIAARMVGKIACKAMFSTVHTNADITQIDNYLVSRY
jgi:hypothetical protein